MTNIVNCNIYGSWGSRILIAFERQKCPRNLRERKILIEDFIIEARYLNIHEGVIMKMSLS